MMKRIAFFILFIIPSLVFAQRTYSPTWESIDKRPIPEWFQNAKFGIFIHWGLYSVPAWSPRGTYAEWYEYWLKNKTLFGNGNFKGSEIYDYHVNTYGKDFKYSDFAPMFKAQDFDADAWTDLFEKAGAKYVVLTTKHHDGFALWPSKEASRDYGRPWNSMEVGAKRDLVGEYVESLRKTKIKVGCYFSCKEWSNTLFCDDSITKYVDNHFFPQLKDLISRYKPDLIWSDGPDKYDDNVWKTKDLLSWLYSSSEVKDSVVVNDRWAKFSDGKRHGDFCSHEYTDGNNLSEKPWEECRGMGFSFGYNQNEILSDYATSQALVLTLVNVVSKGGNLLLDVGPTANGKIPPIMEERLLQLGDWLKVNGEAIYNTRRWKYPSQWTEGKRDWKAKGKFYVGCNAILKQTVDPDSGYAAQEVFYTWKAPCLYAILPKISEEKVILKNLQSNSETQIEMLGFKGRIQWKQKKDNIEVVLPRFEVNNLPCLYAWTLRITNVSPK